MSKPEWVSGSLEAGAGGAQPTASRHYTARPATPALLECARTGEARLAVVFGGQGAAWLPALRELYTAHLAVRTLVTDATARLRDAAANPRLGALATPARGFNLRGWIEDPDQAPPADVLASSLVSQAGIFLASTARLLAMGERGFDLDALGAVATAATGHSQGVMAALLFAEGHAFPQLTRRAAEFAGYFFWQGYRMQESFVLAAVPPAVRLAAEQAGLGDPSPMAAVAGLTDALLSEALARFHAANPNLLPIDVSLDNGYTRKVLSGPPASLVAFARALAAFRTAELDAFAKGRLGRRPLEFAWEFVAASAPFHARYMEAGRRALAEDIVREGIRFSPQALRLPVLGNDGTDLRTAADDAALTAALLRMQHVEPVRWGAVCAALRGSHPDGVTHILEHGPGDAVAKLTALNCRGYGVHVFPLATEAGRRDVALPRAQLPRGADYRRFAPTLRRTVTGEVVLDNAFRRFTGRAPVFLPGMTPTTTEAPLVAAAANAGFVSELAGGGQVTERHFRLRARELARALHPGAAYVVNLLYLDPYLWSLHWKGEGVVRKLRAEGAAIEGITVSAGVPELDEALALLATCRALGLTLVSFKPGTAKQIKAVLDIARAAPDMTIGVQIEGGKAGGHHSWEDLRDLLRGSYHQARELPNVVLSVGGGIRNEADAWAWLSGAWSEPLGLAPMPVDAVFLGTLTMAAKEAMTSPQVKRLLATTRGTDAWVAQGASQGGMTSGRSQLDADIHYVDNAAAQVGRLLDAVAGDAAATLARKDEIVAALARTARPYFGDVAEMTPAAVLRRMVALLAIGRGGDYDDGRWLDPSYRQRVRDMALRFEQRLAREPGPSMVRGLDDLDDPEGFVARFVARYPEAERLPVGQADADYFVHRVCARPGKPVNFVPVIDRDVRRWYKSDALWLSHDDRFDADQVLVIPGPEAVQGITRVDEPVGDILGRFVAWGVAQLEAAGQRPLDEPDALDDDALARAAQSLGLVLTRSDDGFTATVPAAPARPADVRAWFDALDPVVLAPLAAARGVLRDGALAPNPLARMLRLEAGDRWHGTLDPQRRLAALSVQRADGHGVTLTLGRTGHEARVEVTLHHCPPPDRSGRAAPVSLALAFACDLRHPGRYPREVTADRGAALGAFYRAVMVRGAAPVPAGEVVTARFTVDRDFVREYALASGDASVASLGGRGRPPVLPLNAAFSVAFDAILRAAFVPDVAWDPSRLVHLENTVRCVGPVLQDGDTVDVRARLVAWEPARGGVRVRVEAALSTAGTARAEVESAFFVQGEGSRYRFRAETQSRALPAGDPARLDLLLEKPWVQRVEGATLDPAAAHAVTLSLRTETRDGRCYAEVTGTLCDRDGRAVATVHETRADGDATDTDAARWFAHFAPAERHTVALPQPSAPHVERAFAPWNLLEFARASRDANPLHRDAHAAALAGFDGPIVHGQWTAARAVAAAVSGFAATDGERVRAVEVSFTDAVLPGDAVEFVARHSAMERGDLLVDIEARVQDGDEGRLVLRGRVRIAAPRTAYVFPGQGVQAQGMGMEGYARSAAARKVWDEADAICRDRMGFSLLTVVRDNPVEMRVGLEVHRHEQGVLFLTQFTQVAMAVLAIAQVAELRESGCFQEDALFCGHSVGEYSAIGAITDALSLGAMVECVYQRGLAMQTFVPRDAQGRSPYRMAVVRPNIVRMNEAELSALVARIARETGLLCEVVNLNIRGRQYSVVGHVPALEALRAALVAREPAGSKPSYLEVPGIDVPFHSVALRSGVAAFRERLETYIPAHVDVVSLVGRYIPNLVARPFALTRAYLDEVAACTGSEVLTALQARWDADAMAPTGLGRALFIEGLAYQFASPVRWIETQDLLLARDRFGVSRVVEIGLGAAPTQANMVKATLAMDPSRLDPPAVYNVEADRKAVFHVYDPDADAPAAPVAAPAASAPAPVAAPPASAPAPVAAPTAAGPLADVPLSVTDALRTLLALKARVRADEVRPEESIEQLTGGNSSRRNQVMADLGAEFAISAVDGAHELPFTALAEAVQRACGGRYRTQGPYLRAQVTATLKPYGLTTRDALAAATAQGLPEGRALTFLNRVALWLRAGDSTRAGALCPMALPKANDRGAATAWLSEAVVRFAREEGFALPSAGGGAAGASVDAKALEQLLARYFGVGGAFLESLRFAEAALGRDVWAELEVKTTDDRREDDERLARYDAEHGAGYDRATRPAFASERAVVFAGAWAWSRREALALYHGLRRGALDDRVVSEMSRRIGRGADEATARTVQWLWQRAEREGDARTAAVFASLVQTVDPRALALAASEAVPLSPAVEVRDDGRIEDFERPRGESSAVAVAEELVREGHARMRAHGPDADDTVAAAYTSALSALAQGALSFAGRTALVTGASDGSIAIELVKLLLTGGARVVVTTSQQTPERVRFYRRLYQRYGARGSELAVVPFNQGSRQDIQRLVAWLVATEKTTVGGTQRVVKDPWLVDLLVPFGAVGEEATLAELSDRSMATLRVLLYGVEALVSECARAFSRLHVRETRTHVLLPLSPNHGQFGNDGLYGEAKAALEAMLNRWGSEQAAWGRHTSLVGARIGWVRGTGLMNVNNAIAPGLEAAAGVRTFSAAEMGLLLGACCADTVRAQAAERPLVADLTGGMDRVHDLAGVARTLRSDLMARVARARRRFALRAEEDTALGRPRAEAVTVTPAARFDRYFAFPPLPSADRREALAALRDLDLSRVAVIVGLGEVGPWGATRPRWSMESTGVLSLEACIELAWMTGRIRYERGREHVGWVDAASGEPVAEHAVKARYEEALLADAGIRLVDPKVQGFDPRSLTVWADVSLEQDFVFPVPGKDEGEAFVAAAGDGARLVFDPAKDGWFVVRKKGTVLKVARAARLDRYVAGQVPTGWDPVRYGIPKDLAAQVDRTTLFNLVASVEAFLSAGLEPEELFEYLHPADVGSTQGAGIGGMQKLRKLYTDHLLDRPRQGDALQETLINVAAAWVVQSLVGSYGPMVHPVGACATAAVSVEEAADKVLNGKAAFIVAGGYDDYGEEGALGFSDMAATCDTDDMLARGIPPREMSRPNDRRRRGFVEAQGGGTVLVARADLAVRMGLPLYAAVALARSYGDGIHRSIPAPGPGVMAVAAERKPQGDELSGEALCDLARRREAWNTLCAQRDALAAVVGADRAEALLASERRGLFHDIAADDLRVSPLRRALAVFGLGPDDVAAAWKHDTSTDANDPNENRAYDRIFRWLGRAEGNPLVVVSQKALTGHSKGGAAAWQVAGLCQGLATGIVPGNANLDDPDPVMRAYETIAFTDAPLHLAPGAFEAGMVTSLGFGHVGGVLCLVHPDRVLGALDDAAFADYAARRNLRERQRLRDELGVFEGDRPGVRIRTDKRFVAPTDAPYAGFEPEHAALLDASSRRLSAGGPIVAGGNSARLDAPAAPVASPRDL